jgi:hypothetical protein
MSKWVKAGLILLGMIILVTVADLYWTTSGDYMKLLSGFSILGWTAVFAVLFMLLKRNFLKALGTILIFTAVEDFIYNVFVDVQGHTAILPMRINFDVYRLYGAWATGFGQIWFGVKAIYVWELVVGTMLILAGSKFISDRIGQYFLRPRAKRASLWDSSRAHPIEFVE